MLTHPTLDKLHPLRCPGMADALAEPLHSPLCDALSPECARSVADPGSGLGILMRRRTRALGSHCTVEVG